MMNLSNTFVRALRVLLLFLGLSLAQTGFAPPVHAQTVVQDDVDVVFSRLRINRRSGDAFITVTLTNSGAAPLVAPYQLEFTDISPVTLTVAGFPADADGMIAVPFGDDLPAGAAVSLELTLIGLGRSRINWTTAVTTEAGNTPPVADAGPDQVAVINTQVTLDGTGSSDAEGQALTYAWRIVTAPVGSATALSDPTAAQPVLTPDVVGSYTLELVVNDGIADSDPDAVVVSSENLPPVADAGPDIGTQVGVAVTLSGAASTDPNGDALSYDWAVTSAPAGSGVASSGSGVTFVLTPDVAGSYTVALTVSDGIDSASDSAVVSVDVNEAPVADAGPDAGVAVGAAAMLDGSGSSDPEGALVTYLWSLIAVPAGSAAALDDPALAMPGFTADLPGTYVAQLIVSDGSQASAPDTVTITTDNVAPTAAAGPDQAVALGSLVQLDGSGSSDVDGDALNYGWALLSIPAGSVTTLSDPAAVAPTFLADRPGDYVVQLQVGDGSVQDFDTVTISTLNTVPVADAGPDQSGPVGASITFDGSGSADADGDPLIFSWVLASRPAGSGATLTGAETATPGLVIDYPGTYVAQLIVSDSTVSSALDSVTLTTINSRPVADAGNADDTLVGLDVALSGAASSDADFDPLSFGWALISAPDGSTATLSAPGAQDTTLTPDLPGTYVAQLIVNDGTLDSAPATLAFEAGPPEAGITASALRGAAPLEIDLGAAMQGGFGPYTYLWDNGVTAQDYVRTFASPGSYEVAVTITDSAGNVASDSETITVLVAPTVDPTATPDQGLAPLEVTFGAAAADADGTVVLYEWDFTDDGSFDYSDANSAAASFTYSSAGRYTARLRVTDDDALATEATLTITVGEPPILNAAATPLTGTAPLEVTFTATASDPDGEIARYEWDFESDGVVDFNATDNGDTTHTYTTGGIFNATARVYDDDGLLAERSFVVSVAGPPTALPRAFPLSGEAPLTVTFFASGSDFDGSPEYYDWDYNGDGYRDQRLIASMNSTYTYTAAGTYQAALTVVDDDGLTDTKTVEIVVGEGIAADPLEVSASATPDNGGAPLEVTLIGKIDRSQYSIDSYGWDLDGDGTDDFTEGTGRFARLGARLYLSGYTNMDFADMDGDGLMDLVVGHRYGNVEIYYNTGTANVPKFDDYQLIYHLIEQEVLYCGDYPCDPFPCYDEVCAPFPCDEGELELEIPCDFEGEFPAEVGGPVLLDEGGDLPPLPGDLPPLPGDEEPRVEIELIEVVYDQIGGYTSPRAVDVNGDGLLDLLVGNYNGTIDVLINPGLPKDDRQVWTLQDEPLTDTGTVIDVGFYSSLALFDHDNDGDADLTVGDSNGQLYRITRGGTAAQPVWTFDPTPLTDATGTTIDVGSRAAPAFTDLDGDGVAEMVVGNSAGRFRVLRNTGSATAPLWTVDAAYLGTPTGGTVDLGSYAVPAFLDYTGDGTAELWGGDSGGTLEIYVIQPDGTAVYYLIFDEIDVGSYAAPALVNLDGDTDFDMVVGNSSGTLQLLFNLGDATTRLFRIQPVLRNPDGTPLDIGSYAAPAVMDVDGDNDPDLIVGNSSGRLFLLPNTGTPGAPVFESQVPITYAGSTSLIDVGSYATPFVADLDGDGVQDLLVGNSSGQVYQLLNTGTNAAPAWGSRVRVGLGNGGSIDVGSYAAPVMFDSDSDGVKELYIGTSAGVVFFYENDSATGLSLTQISDNVFDYDVGSRAVPTLADLDADGDADVILGNSSGQLYQAFTRGQLTVTFDQPGTYMPVFSAADSRGNTASAAVTVTVTATGSPTATLAIDKAGGTVPLDVTFRYGGSDPDGPLASFVLDVDGDGTPEVTETTAGEYTHRFNDAGIFTATLEVTDSDGNIATKSLDIDAQPAITTSLAATSFSPVDGGTALINTQLFGASGLMTVEIVDGAGGLVRRLVDGLSRTPGDYQDAWDGRDDAGQLVRDGAYYVVVSVAIDGRVIRYDAREDAIFEELTPSRSWSNSLNPYLGDPVAVSYQIPWPAEVSLYFWTRDNSRVGSTIAPVRTVFLRLPRSSGRYTDYWDGFNDQGVAVDPGPQYPITLWLYRLPPNAIIVAGSTPEITAIDVEPRLFNPVFNPYSPTGATTANLSVAIDKPATLAIDILNAEGLSVRRITADNRPSGPNAVTWDGRDGEGSLVAPGTYSIGVVAVDQNGNRSLPRYAATTVRY